MQSLKLLSSSNSWSDLNKKQKGLKRLYFQHLNPKVDSNIKSKFPNFESI